MFKLTRKGSGPVLEPDSRLPWENEGVFNPGVVKIDGEVYMLYRAVGERQSYISHFGLAKSTDGVHFERVSGEPVFGPDESFDQWAVEDPRITKIGEYFYVTYVAVSERIMKDGQSAAHTLPLETSIALLKTGDFVSFENLGVISPLNSDNKDGVLFPRQINGRYYLLHRPHQWSKEWFNSPYEEYREEALPCPAKDLPDVPSIWISTSADLKNWTDHRLLFAPNEHDGAKIGPGMPPIETEDGWLVIYHHVTKEPKTGQITYTARAALLDLADPTRVIARLPYDILAPEMPYEMEGGTKIVFPTGGFISDGTLYVYYGSSDRYVCLATGSLAELLKELKKASAEKLN